MASKKGKSVKSPTNNLSVDNKSGRKSARFRDSKGSYKDETKETSLAFKILSSSQTKEFVELETVDDVQMKMAEIMKISLYAIDLKDAALLDYYTGALWYGREQSFSIEQLSAFFTLVHTLIHNIKEKQMTIVDNLKELKRTMTGVGQEGSEHSGGLECFSVQQVKLITDYIHRSIFQHYKMYEFMFSTTQAEEIIGTDLKVEVAQAADVPWPPPLEESVDENLYREYISTSTTPVPQEGEDSEGQPDALHPSSTEKGDEVTETVISEKEADLLSQLSPDEVKSIMTSVMYEMVQGLKTEVAQMLREKEVTFLNRINKIHKVEDKK